MGAILGKINREISEVEKQLQNKSISADEREFLEEELADLKAEKEKVSKEKEIFTKGKSQKPKLSTEEKKERLKKTPKKEEKPKEEIKKEEPKPGTFSSLEVGAEIVDEDSNKIKRTASGVYQLHYHKGENTVVVFNKEGEKWIVDCCEKKGIEFHANDIDNAVKHIIEGLDCHYEMKDRVKNAAKRKEARKKYEKMSEQDKIDNTVTNAVDSVEKRVEEIKEDGKGITTQKAKSFGVDIAKLVKVIEKGITEKSEQKKFIQNLISELQKLLK